MGRYQYHQRSESTRRDTRNVCVFNSRTKASSLQFQSRKENAIADWLDLKKPFREREMKHSYTSLLFYLSVGDDEQPWRVEVPSPGGKQRSSPLIGHQSPGARSLGEEDRVSASSSYEASPLRVRVRSCLGAEQDRCSDYTEAEIGPSYISQAGALTTPAVIAIVVSCVVFLLCSGLIFVFCRCRKNQIKKGNGKDYEMDTSTVRPSLVTQQPPPPYYPTTGLENKALEHSLDLALDDQGKNAVYASQNGYGYHGNTPTQGPQGHNINGGECE
uniref:(California timema) hypothetical protein n=1 Tax=Timema californicum TaxID=61474 RepID=A0A7R9PA81_TIMCA|nr:unnamed protein product [Timema californicum]